MADRGAPQSVVDAVHVVPELTGATIAGLLLGLTARHWVPRLLAADRRVDVLVRDRIVASRRDYEAMTEGRPGRVLPELRAMVETVKEKP